MSDRPLLSMTLIARDEEANVERCFSSWWDTVDEVVLVDTGSRDATVAKAREFARKRKQPKKLKVATFEWCEDFAAARQAADDLATGRWLVWCDLDDEIRGLEQLRQMAADASEHVVAFFCRYSYAQDAGGAISELWRERVVRHNGVRWTGRLHEHKLFEGAGHVVQVDPASAEWIHHRDHTQRTGQRNIRILEAWDAEQPDTPRIVQALAMEYMGDGRHQDAADSFARYLQMPGEPPDRRAQATRHYCQMLLLLGQPEQARAAALGALGEMWLWADTHLTLAEAEHTLGHPDVALAHAQTALTIGKPRTWLIVNPQQYTAHPRALIALCLGAMGEYEQAVRAAEDCLEISPGYPLAAQYLPAWRAALKREQVVSSWLACCEVLVEAGELLKARELLGSAPFYVARDPRLADRRASLAREISRRLADPPPAVEDEAADAFVRRHLREPVLA